MRKIEAQMIAAINNNKDWQSANTSVHFNEENDVSVVRLHGNKIAEVGDDFVTIFDGGWQTNTTKSRLNVIINEFCNAMTDGVFQKDFQWYIKDNNVIRDFENGYIFSWYFLTLKFINSTQMKIFFVALFTILGANLAIDLLDSNMVQIIQERNNTIQRQIDQMWSI